MKTATKQIEIIDQYIDNEMEINERTSFENELETNSDLRKQLGLILIVNRSLQKKEVIEYRKCISDIRKNMLQKSSERYKSSWFTIKLEWYYAAAVSILLIGTAIVFYLLLPKVYNNQQLFAMNYKRYPASAIVRSKTEFNNSENAIIKSYETANYKYTLRLINNSKKEINNNKISLIEGICFIEINDLNNAINSFKQLSLDTKSIFYRDAQWYLALCYLKVEKKEKAKLILRQIAFSRSPYNRKANEILNRMKDIN